MSRHRHNPRRDANEAEIVAALEAAGATVQRLNERDCPDLLIGYRGLNLLAEVKLPLGPLGGSSGSSLTDGQERWHARWGGQVAVLRTAKDATSLLRDCTLHVPDVRVQHLPREAACAHLRRPCASLEPRLDPSNHPRSLPHRLRHRPHRR